MGTKEVECRTGTRPQEEARKLIDNLPSLSSWEQLMYEIYVREAIENGLVDSIEGRKTSVADVRAEFDLE